MKRRLLKLTSLFFFGAAIGLQAQGVVKVAPDVMKDQPFTKKEYTGTEPTEASANKNQTRYPGISIGETYYDLQSNGSNQRRIVSHGAGLQSATWTTSLDEFDTTFPNRGTGYNTGNGGNWGDIPASRLETLRTGWPSLSVKEDGSTIIVSHVSDPNAANAIWILNNDGSGTWTETGIQSNVPTTTGHLWPRSVVTEDGKLHVMALTTPVANMGAEYNGIDGHLLYYRSADNGQTWEVQDAVLPGLDSSNYLSMGADAYAMDANDGVIAFAHFDDWNDITVYKSEDGGDSWERIVVNDFPLEKYTFDDGYTIDDIGGVDTLGPGGNPTADSAALKSIYTSDNSGSVVVDNNGKIHLFYGEMYVSDATLADGNASYYPGTNGLAYWNEDMIGERPITLTGALDNDGNGVLDIAGIDNIATYFFSLSSMPYAVVDENNHMYLTYSAAMEDFTSVDEQHYRHVYLMKSEDTGETWTDPIDVISPELFDDEELYAFVEAVFPTISVDNQFVHLIFQQDYEPGLHVRGDEDASFLNEIIYLKFDRATLTLNEKVVQPEKFDMSLTPNPASDVAKLSFDLQKEAQIQIEIISLDGQVLNRQNLGSLSSGTYSEALDVQNLNAGMYMVKLVANQQAATMRLIVK